MVRAICYPVDYFSFNNICASLSEYMVLFGCSTFTFFSRVVRCLPQSCRGNVKIFGRYIFFDLAGAGIGAVFSIWLMDVLGPIEMVSLISAALVFISFVCSVKTAANPLKYIYITGLAILIFNLVQPFTNFLPFRAYQTSPANLFLGEKRHSHCLFGLEFIFSHRCIRRGRWAIVIYHDRWRSSIANFEIYRRFAAGRLFAMDNEFSCFSRCYKRTGLNYWCWRGTRSPDCKNGRF